jgi:hypothetical protein
MQRARYDVKDGSDNQADPLRDGQVFQKGHG